MSVGPVTAAAPASTAQEGPPAGSLRTALWRRRLTAGTGRAPLSLLVLALPATIGAVRLLLAAHRPFDFFGDEAILESSVAHVGRQLVGPYSRFGFHQPGPAYYWLQAPFYRLPGASPAALFLGAFCINLGAAVGCVAVARRFLGEAAARWTAVLVGALLLCLAPGLVTDPWNPYVLALPVLLCLLLMAAAPRSPAAGAGGLVVASCIVQTHIAAAVTLAAVFAVAGGVAVADRRRARPGREALRPAAAGAERAPGGRWRRRRGAAAAAAGLLLVLLWTPPVVDQVVHSPGNLRATARFFRAPHPEYNRGFDHSAGRIAGQVAAELTVVPFGHDRHARPTEALKVVLALAGLAIGAAVAVAGWRRREPVIATLGATSVVGPLAAVWSGTRIVGEVYPYLLVWTSPLLLPGLVGAGALLLQSGAGRVERVARPLAAAAAVGLGLTLTVTMARHPLVPYPTVTDVAAAARITEPWLAGQRVQRVRVRIAQHDRWPLASGVAVRLEDDGFRSTVDQEWTPVFGDHFRPTGHEQATIWIADAAAPPPATPALTPLGTVGSASVWAGNGF